MLQFTSISDYSLPAATPNGNRASLCIDSTSPFRIIPKNITLIGIFLSSKDFFKINLQILNEKRINCDQS